MTGRRPARPLPAPAPRPAPQGRRRSSRLATVYAAISGTVKTPNPSGEPKTANSTAKTPQTTRTTPAAAGPGGRPGAHAATPYPRASPQCGPCRCVEKHALPRLDLTRTRRARARSDVERDRPPGHAEARAPRQGPASSSGRTVSSCAWRTAKCHDHAGRAEHDRMPTVGPSSRSTADAGTRRRTVTTHAHRGPGHARLRHRNTARVHDHRIAGRRVLRHRRQPVHRQRACRARHRAGVRRRVLRSRTAPLRQPAAA